jgi:hypothetical protein
MVFLPANTPVDRHTGSKYASELQEVNGEEKRVLVQATELVDSLVDWFGSLDPSSSVMEAIKFYKDSPSDWHGSQEWARNNSAKTIARELESLGMTPDTAIAVGDRITIEMIYFDTLTEEKLRAIAKQSGAEWKRAEDTVSSKEYWEKYFEEHPDQRPKHLVYYDDEDPTSAVYEFQQRNGIGAANTSDSEGVFLGFDDHHIEDMRTDPRARKGYDELEELGLKLIDEKFQ